MNPDIVAAIRYGDPLQVQYLISNLLPDNLFRIGGVAADASIRNPSENNKIVLEKILSLNNPSISNGILSMAIQYRNLDLMRRAAEHGATRFSDILRLFYYHPQAPESIRWEITLFFAKYLNRDRGISNAILRYGVNIGNFKYIEFAVRLGSIDFKPALYSAATNNRVDILEYLLPRAPRKDILAVLQNPPIRATRDTLDILRGAIYPRIAR